MTMINIVYGSKYQNVEKLCCQHVRGITLYELMNGANFNMNVNIF